MLIFFKLIFLFQHSTSLAQNKIDRIDLDYRYIISELSEFSKLSSFLINNHSQNLNFKTKKLTIDNKPYEFFIDMYYDSNNFSLYQSKSSLRYRSRFKNTNQSIRNIHYKLLNLDNLSYNEFKLKVKEYIKDEADFIDYLLDAKNSETTLNIQKKVNIRNLKYQFTVVQNRDRYYLKDQNGITVYTISLDRTLFKKNNINKMLNFVEFEINELIYASGTDKERSELKSNLKNIIVKIQKKFDIIKVNKSKYEMGFDNLEIKKNQVNFNIDNILILFPLFILLSLIILIYIRKPKF